MTKEKISFRRVGEAIHKIIHNKKDENGITCPLCGEFIPRKLMGANPSPKNKQVIYWSCLACPFIGFEFYSKRDIIKLSYGLRKKNNLL